MWTLLFNMFKRHLLSGQCVCVFSVCVCLCVCLPVDALTAKPLDLGPRFLAWMLTLTLVRMDLKVKVIGQSSRSNIEIAFFCLASDGHRCQGHQDQGQRSSSNVKFVGQGHQCQSSL